ncbi:MAG: FG-GAP repeat domain-containing protein, partial [Planctomycetota bacterium]
MRHTRGRGAVAAAALVAAGLAAILVIRSQEPGPMPLPHSLPDGCAARRLVDPSGFTTVMEVAPRWKDGASLKDVALSLHRVGYRLIESLGLDAPRGPDLTEEWIVGQILKASLLNYEGEVGRAEDVLAALRATVEPEHAFACDWLATIAYVQGVTALRRGENDNCIHCAGASACILPIAEEAVHTVQTGSRAAVRRFTEILEAEAREGHPDDLEVQWLLNLAHMTLGEWPHGVDPRFRLPLERFFSGEPGVAMPRFEDVSRLVGLDRMNEAGGAFLEDLDGDGLLDAVLSTYEPTLSLAVYRNRGDGTFEDRTVAAGVADQIGALNCVQTDFDNDGFADIHVVRGAWLPYPIRPSLLRNRGDGTFEDVTAEAGMAEPVNSNSASWADFDNDGFLDVFVCCEKQPNKLYRNLGDGTFADVAARAGVAGPDPMVKGAAWIDYDNDAWPDLFVNILGGRPRLHRNERDGTFREVTKDL